MSETPKVIIPGNLKGSVPENIVTDALYILDSSRAKNQKVINDEFEQRIDDIQELAEISIEGGTIQIATAADFNNPTQEQRAKVPTVGAVLDGYTANILPNTGNPSTPIYIDNFHKPQVVTSILLPGNISSQNGNLEALNGGVAALGIADLSYSGGGGGDTSAIKFDNSVIYTEGEPYFPEAGIVSLPPYPGSTTVLNWGYAKSVKIGVSGTVYDASSGVITLPEYPDISGKVDKVSGGTTGNFVSLTSEGDLQDAGVSAASFATSAQGAKADSAIQGIKVNGGNVIAPDANKIVNITDVASANTLSTLMNGLSNVGNHSLPVYFGANATPSIIDSLNVPGNIESTSGGVTAWGIADLAISGGGGSGTLTQIQIDGTIIPDVNGVVNLPAYPTWATLSGKPILATVATTGDYDDLINKPTIPQGTVTSVGMTVPTGLSVSPTTITTNGTFAITFATGYSIPTTSAQTAWTNKYDKPSGGIPKSDLVQAVQTSLGKADSAIQEVWVNGSAVAPDTNKIVKITDVASAATLSSHIGNTNNPHQVQVLVEGNQIKTTNGTAITVPYASVAGKVGTTNVGSASLPIYLAAGVPTVINSLEVTGNIQSTQGGVSANGIADLSISGGGGSGTLTEIQVNGVEIPDVNGIVNISATTGSVAGEILIAGQRIAVYGLGTAAYTDTSAYAPANHTHSFSTLNNIPTTLSGYGITDAKIVNGVITLGSNTITPLTSHQAIYALTVKNSEGGTEVTYDPKTSASTLTLTKAMVGLGSVKNQAITVTSTSVSDGTTTFDKYVHPTSAGYKHIPSGGASGKLLGYGGSSGTAAWVDKPSYNFSEIGNTPTTLSDYGITDGVNTVSVTGSGNAVTTASVSGHTITLTKGSSFKTVQTAVTDPTASSTAIDFIATISQNTNGVISATKKTVRSASQSQSGVVTTGSQQFAGAKQFNSTVTVISNITSTQGNIQASAGGVAAYGIADLSLSGGSGTGTLTQIQVNGITVPDSSGIVNLTATQGDNNGQIKIAGQNISITGLGDAAYCGLGSVASGSQGLVTGGQVYSAISALPTPMQFKGSLGVGGTYTSSTLPAAAASNSGWTLKVITNGTYRGVVAEVGDQLISDGTNWILIPSGDEPSGTVTSVAMTVPTGLSVSGSPITSSGTFAISFASGYSIPTTTKQGNWDTAYTHATDANRLTTAQTSGFYKFATTAEGHIKSVTAVAASDLTSLIGATTYAPYNSAGYLPLSGGTMTGAITMGKNPIRFSTSNDSDWNIGEDSSSSHLRILNALGTAGTGAVATYSVALSVKGYYGFQLACKSSRNEFYLRDLKNGASDPRDWQTIFTSANANLSTVDWATKKLTASDQIVSNVATGTAPLSIASTTLVTNLNADLLDGKHSSNFVSALGTSGDYLTWTKTGGNANNIIVPYASLATDTRVESLTNQTITYRQTAGGSLTYKPTSAVVKRILGNSVVWNQLISNPDIGDGTGWSVSSGASVSYLNGIASITKNATSGTAVYTALNTSYQTITSHVYLFKVRVKSNNTATKISLLPTGAGSGGMTAYTYFANWGYINYTWTATANATYLSIRGYNESDNTQNVNYSVDSAVCIDLTLFFNGNIPTGLTAETFERDYGYLLANPEYNAGTIINNACSGLESGGFNVFNNHWNACGLQSDGSVNSSDTSHVHTDYIHVNPNANYYLAVGFDNIDGIGSLNSGVYMYDACFNFISKATLTITTNARTFTTVSNCAYLRFDAGFVINKVANLNLSDSTRNGQYEPYRKNTLPLGLNSFRVKDAQGNISTINGLKKAGSVYDEIVGRKFIQRIGSILYNGSETGWALQSINSYNIANFYINLSHKIDGNGICNRFIKQTSTIAYTQDEGFLMSNGTNIYFRIKSSTASTVTAFKTWLASNPVTFNYELATPIEYEIIDDLPTTYAIDTLGTEGIVSDELAAPFIADIQYGARQTDIAYDIDNLFVSSVLLRGRATTLEGYFTDGIANNAARLSNTSAIGSTTKPVFFTANGVPAECSTYGGGTAVTLNGSSKAASTASFYAPTGAGTAGQILKSTAGTPEWINQSAITAGALTTVSKTLFGNTYWTSGGVPTSIGTSSSPAALNYVTNIDSILYFERTNNRVGIGTSSPSERLAVDGTFRASGNSLIGGTFTASGATTLSSTLTVAGATTISNTLTVSGNISGGSNVQANGGVSALGIVDLTANASGSTGYVTQIYIGTTSYIPSNGIVSLPAYPSLTWANISGKPTALSDFTNDAGYITDLEVSSTMSTTPSITAEVGMMYLFGRSINSLTVTLPTMTDATRTKMIMFLPAWATGKNAATFTSTHTIRYLSSYQIDAGCLYLIKALFTGNVWVISADKLS